MAESNFRTFYGVVQFPPREGQAAGKDVRNITLRPSGVKEQALLVSATLWPSFAHVEVEEGDAVIIEGKFQRNVTEKDGEKKVYNNLSTTGILVLGKLDEGVRVDVENAAPADDVEDDDIPY